MLASREKISIRQAIILFIMFVYSPVIRLLPVTAAKIGERAGWLSPIFGILPFVCLVYIMQALFKKEKDANLSDIFFKIIGKIPGIVLLTLYLIWIMITLAIHVRYFAERFLTSSLPNTPMDFFIVTLLAITFYVVRCGLVKFTRTVEFLFLVFSVVFVALFILTISNFEVLNLFPVTYHDVLPMIQSSSVILATWGSFTYIFFFADKINNKEHIKRFGLQSTIYLVITAIMVLLQTIGVYGYSVIKRVSMPYFFVIKSISIMETIERIESVAIVLWVISDFATISLLMIIIISIIKSIFSLSVSKSLVSPITILAFIFSHYIAKSRFELENFSENISPLTVIIFCYVFPLIIFIIGKLRKKI